MIKGGAPAAKEEKKKEEPKEESDDDMGFGLFDWSGEEQLRAMGKPTDDDSVRRIKILLVDFTPSFFLNDFVD